MAAKSMRTGLDFLSARKTWRGAGGVWLPANAKDGVVTLTGRVDARRQRYLAEDITEAVAGVKDIENHLRVNSNRQRDPSDSPLL